MHPTPTTPSTRRDRPRAARPRVAGAALALAASAAGLTALGFGGIGTGQAAGQGEAPVFIPITPCRLADTRLGDDHVGTRTPVACATGRAPCR